jgi:hypothetical protein
MNEWLALCFIKSIIKRASITALVVGTILIVINHGDTILYGQVDSNRLFKIALTVCVPYINLCCFKRLHNLSALLHE